MDIVKLVEGRLNVNDISQSVKSPKCGAISLFIGTTRDNFDGLKVCKNKQLCSFSFLFGFKS